MFKQSEKCSAKRMFSEEKKVLARSNFNIVFEGIQSLLINLDNSNLLLEFVTFVNF